MRSMYINVYHFNRKFAKSRMRAFIFYARMPDTEKSHNREHFKKKWLVQDFAIVKRK